MTGASGDSESGPDVLYAQSGAWSKTNVTLVGVVVLQTQCVQQCLVVYITCYKICKYAQYAICCKLNHILHILHN